ncbi:hypothetical protein TELCIR_06359 [Teladorsagia circumcincta]|uniref:RUN domain-containing protein n=1 Tax=Teladorsagia circumcincta TaxID=45464 RepID=A0A2G9UNE9_TELCI|nr:hypothetical protein TELCIR_06359 [Teladorsagia circumcincta]
MTEIKTDIGCARAFVRFALGRKLLHRDLATLLGRSRLLSELYKQYAFVRYEDEREQFLYHILSLNAAQFRCFTNTFTKTKMDYQVVIVTDHSSVFQILLDNGVDHRVDHDLYLIRIRCTSLMNIPVMKEKVVVVGRKSFKANNLTLLRDYVEKLRGTIRFMDRIATSRRLIIAANECCDADHQTIYSHSKQTEFTVNQKSRETKRNEQIRECLFHFYNRAVRPQSSSLDLHKKRLINSAEDFEQYYGLVVVSACNLSLPANVTYHWQHYFEDRRMDSVKSECCSATLHCTKDVGWSRLLQIKTGMHTVHLSISSSNGNVVGVGGRSFDVQPLWFAIIGDSFASGEGNPDVHQHDGAAAQWLDERCHRSSKSFAAQVFQQVAAVRPQTYLTFLACAGATVENGILKAESGSSSQLATLESIATLRGRGPDVVILSTGGNDIGFSDIINALVHESARFDISLMDMRFFFVSHQLDLVAERLAAIGTGSVFVPQYFDFTKNQYGEVDASCIASGEMSTSSMTFAERRILRRLNTLLLKKGVQYGWHVATAIPSLFARKGICSSQSFIRSRQESIALQGNAMGAFHPNEAGHRAVAKEILRELRESGVVDVF